VPWAPFSNSPQGRDSTDADLQWAETLLETVVAILWVETRRVKYWRGASERRERQACAARGLGRDRFILALPPGESEAHTHIRAPARATGGRAR
jgi:hypothetical protein